MRSSFRSPTASRCARSWVSAIGWCRPSCRESPSFSAAAGFMRLPAASVLGIPTRVGPFVRTRLFSWPGKMRMGARALRARTPRRCRRIDRRVHDAALRRRGHELPGRAAACRHSRGRRRPAFRAGALPAVRRSGACPWQPAARVPPQAARRAPAQGKPADGRRKARFARCRAA